MILLCLCASRIYNTFSILIRNLGSCSLSYLVHGDRNPGITIILYLRALRTYDTFSISTRSRKKKLGCCSISFLVHPGRSPGMMFLCLSASRIYNTFSISIRSRKKEISLLFYILSGSPRQKSWHDVIMPKFSILIRSRKKNRQFFKSLYSFWFIQVEVLTLC